MGKKYKSDCKGGENCYDERHLCKIAGRKDIELIRGIVKDAKFFCKKCGRAAHEALNLCKPDEI